MHADDRLLLGIRWREKTYIDSTLPFGLRSAPPPPPKYAVDIGAAWGKANAALLGRFPHHRYKRVQTGVGNSTRVVQETGDPPISAQDRGT